MKIDYIKLRIGDRLVRTKSGIFSMHHALYAGFHNGYHLVAENQVNYGVRYITLNQFLSEGVLKRVEYNNFCHNKQKRIISLINRKVGKQYSLLQYNCEHFVNDILTGIVKSNQIQTAVVAGTVISLFLFAKSSS